MAGSEWSRGGINGHLIILPAPVSSSRNVGQVIPGNSRRRPGGHFRAWAQPGTGPSRSGRAGGCHIRCQDCYDAISDSSATQAPMPPVCPARTANRSDSVQRSHYFIAQRGPKSLELSQQRQKITPSHGAGEHRAAPDPPQFQYLKRAAKHG
eukprot:670087-Hanusia_phi.AAC.1